MGILKKVEKIENFKKLNKPNKRIVKKSKKIIIIWSIVIVVALAGLGIGLFFLLRTPKWNQNFETGAKEKTVIVHNANDAKTEFNKMSKAEGRKGWGLFIGDYNSTNTKNALWGDKKDHFGNWDGSFGKYLLKNRNLNSSDRIPWIIASPNNKTESKKIAGTVINEIHSSKRGRLLKLAKKTMTLDGSTWWDDTKKTAPSLLEPVFKDDDKTKEIIDLKIGTANFNGTVFIWFLGDTPSFYTDTFTNTDNLKGPNNEKFFTNAELAMLNWGSI